MVNKVYWPYLFYPKRICYLFLKRKVFFWESTMSDGMLIVTGNKDKQREIREILGGRIEFSFADIDLEEIQGTPEEIVVHKAREACKKTGRPVLVEDFSLEIDALGGFPGPYIKSVLLRNSLPKIIESLRHLPRAPTATVSCVYGYYEGDTSNREGSLELKSGPLLFHGVARGVLVPSRADQSGGFGVDPYFIQEGCAVATSELGAMKNEISARSIALNRAVKYFLSKSQATRESF